MVSAGTLEGMGLFVKTRSKGCNREEILREDRHQTSWQCGEGQDHKEPLRMLRLGVILK